MDDLLNEFLAETNESLSLLDLELVKLERNPKDPDLLGNIFRLLHTIKGTCGFLRLPRLETVAHAGENVLVKVRDGRLEVTPEVVSLILECLDRIRDILAVLQASGGEPPGDDGTLIDRLDELTGVGGPTEHGRAGQGHAARPPVAGPSKDPGLGSQSVRVHVDLLDHLMALVSELVLTRNQCLQALRTQQRGGLHAPLQRLDRIVLDLQEGVLKTRLQPIRNAWDKLPRLVRGLALDLGKKIDLVMTGADTELDRQVLELIGDPLTHMVRNAADHSLETPEERRAAGKPETGTIRLGACHRGGQIVIEVADDGRGLSLDKIARKAAENGLASAAELAALSDQQIAHYIFTPGFSTAEATTAISGRGVGMDVVKTNIEKIGGTIELSSAEAGGTRMLIKIPLALSIVPALVVGCGGERFALPRLSVLEQVPLPPGPGPAVETIDGRATLRLRDRLVPLVELRDLLGAGRPSPDVAPGRVALITEHGAGRLGIVVERAFAGEDIVVKPAVSAPRAARLFSGSTVLRDGTVARILDPGGIAAAAGHAMIAEPRAAGGPGGGSGIGAESLAVLVFRAGGDEPKAVPLALVARLEEIDLGKVERSNGQAAVHTRGQLMPLVRIDGAGEPAREGYQPVVVFAAGGRPIGLMVDEILDIVEGHMAVELTGARPGCLGRATVYGRPTDIIDIDYYLAHAGTQRPAAEAEAEAKAKAGPGDGARRVLLVEDSRHFRDFLSPLLTTAGYEVTAVEDATQALQLCAAGQSYDVIVTDIELPRMDGFAFAEAIKRNTPWRETPLVGLSSHPNPKDAAGDRPVGFDEYVAKSDKDALLQAIAETLTQVRGAA